MSTPSGPGGIWRGPPLRVEFFLPTVPCDYQVSSARSILPTWHGLRGRLGRAAAFPWGAVPGLSLLGSQEQLCGAMLRGRGGLALFPSYNAKGRPGRPRLVVELPYRAGFSHDWNPPRWGKGHKKLSSSKCLSQGRGKEDSPGRKSQRFLHPFLEEDIGGEGRSGRAQRILQVRNALWPGKHKR